MPKGSHCCGIVRDKPHWCPPGQGTCMPCPATTVCYDIEDYAVSVTCGSSTVTTTRPPITDTITPTITPSTTTITTTTTPTSQPPPTGCATCSSKALPSIPLPKHMINGEVYRLRGMLR